MEKDSPDGSQHSSQLEPATVSPEAAAEAQRLLAVQALFARRSNGAGWFYWIAAGSIINTIIFATGNFWGFLVGLGLTLFIQSVAMALENPIATGIAIAINVVIAVGYVGIGKLAKRGMIPAFIVGMVFYGFDGLISLFLEDWLGAAFHVFALFGIWVGFRASLQIRREGHPPV